MRRRWREWLVTVLACLAMVVLQAWTGEFPNEVTRTAGARQPVDLYDATVTVNSHRVGQLLYVDDSFKGRTGVVFLAVNLTITSGGSQAGPRWKVGGRSNGREFAAFEDVQLPAPGFTLTRDVVFELAPDDLAGFTVTLLDRQPIYLLDPQVDIDLGITRDRAAELMSANRYSTVKAVTGKAEVTR